MNEKEIHLKLSDVKIDNNNLDYMKLVGTICGNLRDDLVKLFAIHNVTPRFLPQPEKIELLMAEKLKGREINDETGFTGEWRINPKNVLDLIIDLQNEG